MKYIIEEKEVLQNIESVVDDYITYQGKMKGILKSLLLFFANQEKFETVKNLVALIQTFSDKPKIEKAAVKRYAKTKKYRKRAKTSSVSILGKIKSEGHHSGRLYCNTLFNEEYSIFKSGFKRVMLDYIDRNDFHEIGMFFAREGNDGIKENVYQLTFVKNSFSISCSKFLTNHKLFEKCQALGTDSKGMPRNRFSVKQTSPDMFSFIIPHSKI